MNLSCLIFYIYLVSYINKINFFIKHIDTQYFVFLSKTNQIIQLSLWVKSLLSPVEKTIINPI